MWEGRCRPAAPKTAEQNSGLRGSSWSPLSRVLGTCNLDISNCEPLWSGIQANSQGNPSTPRTGIHNYRADVKMPDTLQGPEFSESYLMWIELSRIGLARYSIIPTNEE